MTDPRRASLAGLLRIHRTWGVGDPDTVDYQLADLILDTYVDATGPVALCRACTDRFRTMVDRHEPSVIRLVCSTCGNRFGSGDALTDHTKTVHGRRPTRDERTPKGAAA